MKYEVKNSKRIYHPFQLWEDYEHGFYDNCSGVEKSEKIKIAVKMFQSEPLTKKYMMLVVNTWKYSCEHNLTNSSLNKIAYIGQAACCLYGQVPNTVTMEAWNCLDIDTQKRSDAIAKTALSNWEEKNKEIQICLNID